DALQWNGGISAYDASHGSGSAQRITHVAAGDVSENSTDAINGGQFFALSSSVSTGLNSLPTTVSSAVTSQINSISSSFSSNYQTLSGTVSSLSTASSSMKSTMTYLNEHALKFTGDGFDAGQISGGKTRASSDDPYHKLMNLADGVVSADSRDAINGGQLYRVKTDVTEYGIRWISDGIGADGKELPTGAYYATRYSKAQKITGVAEGDDSKENSLDAVNGGQLWKVKQSITALTDNLSTLSSTVSGLPSGTISNDPALTSLSTVISSQISAIAAGLGKPSGYDPGTGQINPPKYDITTPSGSVVSANNVKDALENLENYGTKYAKSNSAKAASVAQGVDSVAIGGASMASGTSAVAIGDSASASSANGVALGSQAKVTQSGGVALGSGSVANTAAGKEGYIPVTATQQQAAAIRATKSTEGAVSVGDASKGVYRQITGVAAGTADTDAVNVAQLKGVNNQVGMINEYVNQMNDNIHHVERRAYSGTALAMALSGAYLPSLNGGEQTVGVGVGAYRGYGAVGLNFKAASKNGKVTWGAGVSTTGKETAVNSVLGFKW
ncbi:hypothetical protein H3V11_11160, partial [Snodgrassella sp. W8158]|uniref:YadA family autotransporter adhesin n=1 Tax=Snodgrassella sp. W8158 TaxID=2751018 RepID=UPI00351C1D61|nr:hypothetical protein [Snodgrassella sp. W8158]